MSVPVKIGLKKFRQNTFIIIEGKSDKNKDFFFIIKEGIVRVTKEFKLDEDKKGEHYKAGDFFGIISCMSGHSREESAYALTDVILIVVQRDQFGLLIQNNSSIAMKILRVFSSNLRYIDHKMTEADDPASFPGDDKHANGSEEGAQQMYLMGSYYESKKQYNQAVYAYVRYTEYAPDGDYVAEIKTKLNNLTPLAKDAMNPHEEKGSQKDFKDGTVIFCEHEKGSELYIIQHGQVKITKIVDNKENVIAVLNPGDIFGEMSLLNEKPRSASAIAYGSVSTLAVNKKNFKLMVTTQPQLVTKLITLLSERLWTGYRQLAIKLVKNPVAKMLDLLLLQVQKEVFDIDKVAHTFNFGLAELAGMAGLSQEEGKKSMNEILKLKTLTLVDDGKKIKCSNLLELQKEVNILKTKERRNLSRNRKEAKF